jgi:PAS domain S-box-containing protein
MFFSLPVVIFSTENHVMIVGCDDNLPPYEFLDKEGNPSGFDIDLIKEISSEMNFSIEFKTGSREKIKTFFNENKIDIISGSFFSGERDKSYDFSVPHNMVDLVIICRKNDDIKSEDGLMGKTLALQDKGLVYDHLKSKKIKIVFEPNIEIVLNGISKNIYDCTITNRYTGLYFIKKNNIKNLKTSSTVIDSQKYCFAVHENAFELISMINEGLFILKDNGKFNILHEKWFGVLEPYETMTKNILKYIYISIVILLILSIIIFFWMFSLKRQVIVRTNDLQIELQERKKIEQALLESELLFSTVFKKFPTPMSINADDGKYIDTNENFEIYSGYKKEEVIGKNISELWIFESDAVKNEYMSILREKKEINNFELTLFTKSGKKIIGLSSSVGVRMKGEDIYFTIFNDITERKILEQALVENEEKFRMIFDDSPLGIFQMGFDEKIIYINNSYAKILGYDSVEDAVRNMDKNISRIFVDPGMRNNISEKINRSEKGRITIECELYKKDGSIITAMIFFKKFSGENDGIYFLEGFMEDITTRKNNELKLKDSLHEKDILLKEIHHRVKNNLQIISSLLNLQQNYLKNKDDAKIFKDSQNRVKSMAIIHEKLYESKDFSKVDLKDYIGSLSHYLYLSYGVENNRIRMDLKISNISFEMEKSISFGILLNELISNAFKHAFPDGRPGTISISLEKENNSLILIIKDDGIGFPENFKIENSNSLGLKLVYNLALQLNGKIFVDSNNGVEFKIIFKE